MTTPLQISISLRKKERQAQAAKTRTIAQARANRRRRVANFGKKLRLPDRSLIRMYKASGFTWAEIAGMMMVSTTAVFNAAMKEEKVL